MTSDASPSTIERAFESGATDYLRKPLVLPELRSRIKLQLDFQKQLRRNRRSAEQMEKLAKERARQLMHADRLVTLGTLASGIAHEINNPNTFIRGNAEMLRTAMDAVVPALEHLCQNNMGNASKARFLLDEYATMIDDIIRGADRITAIVKGVKRFAHKSSGYINIIDVNKCVNESLSLVSHKLKNRVTVELDLSEEPVRIQGDSQQIDQVLTNLLVNASDAMQNRAEKRLTIRTTCDENDARIIVEDTGSGIPASVLKKIWDPFFTTKEVSKGTGLGLSLAMRIVEDHSGEIDVSSRAGKGTTFTMRFPSAGHETSSGEAGQTSTLKAAA
jgi:signal transduction histidine kinase